MAMDSFEEVMRRVKEDNAKLFKYLEEQKKDPDYQRKYDEDIAFIESPEYELQMAEHFFESTYESFLLVGGGCMSTAKKYRGLLEDAGRWKPEYEPAYEKIYEYYVKYESKRAKKYVP